MTPLALNLHPENIALLRDHKFLIPHGSMQLYTGDKLIIIMGETDD